MRTGISSLRTPELLIRRLTSKGERAVFRLVCLQHGCTTARASAAAQILSGAYYQMLGSPRRLVGLLEVLNREEV